MFPAQIQRGRRDGDLAERAHRLQVVNRNGHFAPISGEVARAFLHRQIRRVHRYLHLQRKMIAADERGCGGQIKGILDDFWHEVQAGSETGAPGGYWMMPAIRF